MIARRSDKTLMGVGSGKYQPLDRELGFEMPKTSGYAVAIGLNARPSRATPRNLESPDRAAVTRNAAREFYFELETFLDAWRRKGVDEHVVRSALERAKSTSLAMEDVGKWLKGP